MEFHVLFIFVITMPLATWVAPYLTGLNPFSLNAFNNTDTELKLIAAAAIIGLNNGPSNIYKTPIATGIPNVLYPKAQNRFCFDIFYSLLT